ncbi:CaiB/BaiF CoA transferase family protein [Agrococcus carbonis]|uniref:Crotonobetainyl-CoA:carnitine CoA-transferase CaiB n=1 Tax=Agrococcus carbonis TaxID=684552 RepID=A0A1H1NU56_9MICO|nr:CoA transferase [Agrococcus carbonis]SDS02320.1 Crotonobetainyl-CoA:carnitine CoA-transferase CaiB [Agrococcus carbonis]
MSHDAPPDDAPLAGLLVADLSRVLAGPLAGTALADLGARVIKVEQPGVGDGTRTWSPPASATGSTYFDSANRGKESVALDLTDRDDRALARELIARADVVIENFRPGGAARLGLDRDALLREHPRLVWCSITGYGAQPGGADRAGYDFVVQAASGLMHITGDADGPPTKAGVAVVDVLTSKDALSGILAALLRRERTGRGGLVEVALLTSAQAALVNQLQTVLGPVVPPADADRDAAGAPATEPRRAGSAHPSIVPYQLLDTGDGPLAVAVGTDAQFRAFAALLGAPELADDARFATNPQRVAHREALVPLLERALARHGAAVWERRMLAAGLVASRVRTIGEGLELAAELGLEPVVEVRGGAGAGRQPASPIRIDGRARTASAAPPLLGEHDADVRGWLSRPAP